MKVKVLQPFIDLTDGIERKAGEVFECSQTRFNEIKTKLPQWVESIEDPKPTPAKAKTANKRTTRK